MRGTHFDALQPIRQGVKERFGSIDEGVAIGLTIRHDNGPQVSQLPLPEGDSLAGHRLVLVLRSLSLHRTRVI
ncbi:MAG: hypothetical protein ISN28_09155 [Ectothiorhodospiraceae bacterium AqS1]|nr:hypothetical protein [Ectothiorhodospiraceae bacterium AqS1]